jgi:hypothetical protein
MWSEVLLAIEPDALEAVVGGRVDAGPKTVDPKVSQTFQQCTQAFQQGCQQIAQGKQQGDQQLQGMMQQIAQSRAGGRDRSA